MPNGSGSGAPRGGPSAPAVPDGDPGRDGERRALLLDYGGVLTVPPSASFAAFEAAHGIPRGRIVELLVEASRGPGSGPIGAIERGELDPDGFDAQLRSLLLAEGYTLPGDGNLLDALFAAMRPAGQLWDVVRQVRAAGIVTGLLSNSWGTDAYPREVLERHFDVIVISGEVGLRKPDPAIYRLALERLACEPAAVVFVDDLPRNVEAARAIGMHAVLHDGDDAATAAEISAHLGIDLDVEAADQ